MTPINTAPALVRGRHEELLREAGRRRLLATAPRDPGLLQRFALRAAGWGRRPAVAGGRQAALPTYEPAAL